MNNKIRFKKTLLINLPSTIQDGFKPTPLGILYLASYIRSKNKKIKVDIIDGALQGEETVYKKIKKMKPDLIGFSVMTPGRIDAVNIAKKVKKILPNSKILFGGIHPTLMPIQMIENYPFIDFIIKGEGELTLLDLVQKKPFNKINGLVWRNGKNIINNPSRKLIETLDKIPFPAWDLVDLKKYPPRGKGIYNGIDLQKEVRVPMIFSRGCMGSCTFCSTWKVWQGYRHRSGKNVAKELIMLYKKYNVKHFAFQDDTLTGNRQEIISFCDEIIKNKIKIAILGCTRVDHVDLSLLKKMKEAGFYELSFGVESGSPGMLKKINKKTDLEEIYTAAKITKKAGIKFTALMMSNLPTETEKDKYLSKKLIDELKPDDWSSIGNVWIFPGTALFLMAKKAKLIDENFWLSNRKYYIYRGGIEKDPIDYMNLINDWYESISKPILKKIIKPILYIKNKNHYYDLYKLLKLYFPI